MFRMVKCAAMESQESGPQRRRLGTLSAIKGSLLMVAAVLLWDVGIE